MKNKSYDQVYHETLYDAVMACIDEYEGIIKLDYDDYEAWGFESMSYETSQARNISGVKLVKPCKDRKCGLQVNVYRMPSGRYEVSGYVTG
jgi:hypothetical protein